MMPGSGKRVALWAGAVTLVVLAAAAGLNWQHLRFWWLFEPLGRNAQGCREYRHRRTGMVFVRLPGGTFWMGAQGTDPKGQNYDPDAEEDEGPVHDVRLGPFLIGKLEVTQAQWKAVMGANPSFSEGDENPVERVSWNDCQEFLKKLSPMVGRNGCRLPTEAEWEYACRAGTHTRFSYGDDPDLSALGEYGWEAGAGQWGSSHPVGQKRPNPWGLHDMHGNVSEWCHSLYQPYPYDASDGREDPATSGLRILRGGSWFDRLRQQCRTAYRNNDWPGTTNYDHGLRVVLDL